MELIDKVAESAGYILSKYKGTPKVGIILGSGLARLSDEIENKSIFQYEEIPHFPITTVKGHKNQLIFGFVKGVEVICLSGRFHYYEGYNMQEVTFPVRLMKALGVEKLIVSNAAGGLNPVQEVGDLMIIQDHINLTPEHPLRGKNNELLGPRFPDMKHLYDLKMIEIGMQIARKNKLRCTTGVYVGVQGPTFETQAEYKMFHIMGGDAVGMSTVPEVIVARHAGIAVFGISVIADIGYPPERMENITHDIVLQKAREAEPMMTSLVVELIASLT